MSKVSELRNLLESLLIVNDLVNKSWVYLEDIIIKDIKTFVFDAI